VSEPRFVSLPERPSWSEAEMLQRADEFLESMRGRRTVRDFSPRPVPRRLIESCLRAAGTAPSGANLQPWRFVVVSDPALKRAIREAAEAEELRFYRERAPREWLEALAPLGTAEHKPFLEDAPYLIVIFAETYGALPDGRRVKHYYVPESVGIAVGILITGLHLCGLATLTHTPSPMAFLNRVLDRPAHERPFLVLVTGYPSSEAKVPRISKKELEDFSEFR